MGPPQCVLPIHPTNLDSSASRHRLAQLLLPLVFRWRQKIRLVINFLQIQEVRRDLSVIKTIALVIEPDAL